MNIKRIGKAIMVLLLATPALSSMELMAQNLKMPTLEDLLPGGATYRIAENLPGLQWWGDVCIKPGIDSLFAVNPKNGKETLLTTREKVNKVLNSLITPTETTVTPGHKGNKVQHFYNTEFPWPNKPYMLIKLPARYIVYDFEKDEFVKGLPQAGERNGANIDYTPEGGHIAYTVKNNLFVDNKAVTEEPEGIVCGQSVHRNEFGISKGTFWSPQGNLLAFYRMNESMVTPYPLVDITPRIALVDKIRYPMAGMLSHQVTVGIYNPDTQKTVYLNTGDPTNRYFTNISWAPDGKSLYLIEYSSLFIHIFYETHFAFTDNAAGFHAVTASYLFMHIHQFVPFTEGDADLRMPCHHFYFTSFGARMQINSIIFPGKIHRYYIRITLSVDNPDRTIRAFTDDIFYLRAVCNSNCLHVV
jgi:dipeptidyl-peptidase 4